MTAGLLFTLTAGGLVVSCGGPAKPSSNSSAESAPTPTKQLEARLLPGALPDGWTSHPDPSMTQTGPADPSGLPQGCNVMYGEDIVAEATASAAASVTADFQGGRSSEGGEIPGGETLYTFSGGGAVRAMQAIRTLVNRCRTVSQTGGAISTYSFANGPGPRLGDESLVVRADVKQSNAPGGIQYTDATVVRVGSTLIEIHSIPMSRSEVDAIESLMPIAVAQLTSSHPKPVGTPEVGGPG